MKFNTMKLNKGERLVVSKFSEPERMKEREFYGFVKLDGKDHILTTTASYLGEARRILQEDAKKLGQQLTLVRAFQ